MREALLVHAPWLWALCVKVPVSIAAVVWVNFHLTGAWPVLAFWPAVSAIVYLHAFKYWYHRYPMHQKAPKWFPDFSRRVWVKIKVSHGVHHKVLCDEAYRTRDPERLKEIVSDWWVFPSLLSFHYATSYAVFSCFKSLDLSVWSWGELITFFVALSVWFSLFEAVHWFAHVDGTWLDKMFSRTWIIGWLWVYTVEYHREHHDRPNHNFHFLPPWLFDWIFGTGLSPKIYRAVDGVYKARPHTVS